MKKHLDLVKLLSSRIEAAEVRRYFKHMQHLFESPHVEEIFGKLMQFKEGVGEEEVKHQLKGSDVENEDED
jgi:hypothetical protein